MATIRGKAIDEVTNLLENIDGTEKIPVSSGESEPQVVLTGELKDYIQEGMQDELTFDQAPTSGSSNPVTSGGVYANTISDITQDDDELVITKNGQASEMVINYAERASRDSNNNVIKDYYAPIDSPSFGGTPRALTPPSSSNDTRLATTAFVNNAISTKQDTLTFDSTPTQNSDNPVTSGGVYTSMNTLQNALDIINEKIPSAASSSNQLADKAFVNSSISTNTATFRGTYNSLAELQEQTADNNDYGFVVNIDAQGNRYYDRYKYNGTSWEFEYSIESTPFTDEQWDAIQSGIDSALVTKLSALPTATELSTQLSGKQDTLSSSEDIAITNNTPLLADRGTTYGMGYVILRRGTALSTQMATTNTIYEVRYDFDLSANLTIPSGSVLKFNGGSFSGAYTITFDDTILENAEGAFSKDIIPSGTVKGNSVNVDWWQTSKISSTDYTNRIAVTSSDNDTIFANIFAWSSIKEIVFGSGIYGFSQSFIPSSYSRSKVHIKGQGYGNTCLYFPQSEGFLFNRGDLGESIIEDFAIHSNKECIKFHIYASNDRYNACHGNNFKRLLLISDDGDFAFGAVWNYSSFLYGNRFDKIRYWVKEDSACFSHLAGGLGHSYFDVSDTTSDFARNSLGKSYSTIWDACSGVYAKYCNTGAGIKHIYTYKNAGVSSETLGLDSGLGIDGRQGGTLSFENCNFESYLGEFIQYETAYVDPTIEFKNCKFTTHNFADFTNQAHISISNLRGLIGFPSEVYDDTTGVHNASICIADRLNQAGLVEADVSMVNHSGNSVSLANEKLSTLRLFYDGTYHYFIGGDKFSVAEDVISEYKSIIVTDYDFSDPPSEIMSDFRGLPELIQFKNATSSDNTVTLTMGNKVNRSFGSLSEIAPIIMANASQYIITVGFNSGKNKITLIPHRCVLVIGSSVIYPKTYSDYFGYSALDVNVGDVINSLTCVKKNSGIYLSSSRRASWSYTFKYEDYFDPAYSGFALNGYAYLCVTAGKTAADAPEYSTTTNTITTDGTAEFLCLGKNALFIQTRGTTAQRPTLGSDDVGIEYFDTDMNQQIKWNGTSWVTCSDGGTVVNIDTTTSVVEDADIITL